MSNEVWVTWKDANREQRWALVLGLQVTAVIEHLRQAFVKERRHLNIDHAAIEVHEREGGDRLLEDVLLQPYFVTNEEEKNDNPGQSRNKALFLTLPSSSTSTQQSDTDMVLRRLLPLVDVLPALLQEVQLTRKSRLNPWERESARTTGSKRNPEFRQKVITFYKRASISKKNVKCQVLDEYTPIQEAQGKIIAAHIWKASTRGKGLEDFGLEENDVNSPRNGLFLSKGIEDAFDKQQLIEGSTRMFSEVHQKPLLCPDRRLPYRRLLSWHARLTLELRKASLQIENFTSEYDTSPGRKPNTHDPIAYAINIMVEPGDDASVEKD